MTKIIKIKCNNKNPENISFAANVLKNGGIVAFPTETVYGLGANALDENAVSKIFDAKGRPSDNPLIVHVSKMDQVEELVTEIPNNFYKLAEEFWPGPLTLVMKKSDKIPKIVSAGLNTVGVRMPGHPVALSLIRQAGVPIAAPSANISGSPSPTQSEHVVRDLDGKVDVIIDGDDCIVGLESTVIDITGEIPVILRPGGVTAEQISETIGEVILDKHIYGKHDVNDASPKSPGVKYKHYSPKAKVVLVQGAMHEAVFEITKMATANISEGMKVGIFATEQTKNLYKVGYVCSAGDRDQPATIASNLFSGLRDFDNHGVDVIFVEGISLEGMGMAIMNRLLKAAGENVIRV